MMNITYGVTEEIYSFGHSSRTSYGIAAYADAEEDGTPTIVASVHDVSAEKYKVDDLVSLCNLYHLDPEHLCDVIDDFLAY